MKSEDAKAIFLLEYCAERCEGYQNDDVCETCEINFAIKAIDKQIPKKPDRWESGHACCCSCKRGIVKEDNYCCYCGQRIDWSDKV